MGTPLLIEPTSETSVRLPRVAGFFYLLNILTILFAVFLLRGLFIAGDPAATATNVLAHESSFRIGFAFELISTACSIVVAGLFYELFMIVNRRLSLLAAFFRLVACAIAAVGYLFQLAPLQVMSGAHYLSAIRAEELQGLALLLYTFSAQTSHISIVFFGCHFVLIGYLIFTSKFLPRILGILVTAAGLGGLTFLLPPIALHLFLYFAVTGLLAEVSLTLWLLLKGVNIETWNQYTHAV